MKQTGYKIILHTDKGQVEEKIKGNEIQIGRNLSADLPIMASGVSRSHLQIYTEGKKIFLKDLGSTNGTYIKGERVEPHKKTVYTAGERISLGQAGCFIRIECIFEEESKSEKSPVQNLKPVKNKKKEKSESFKKEYISKAVPSTTQVRRSKEDTGVFASFFGSGADVDPKEKRKAEKYMQDAEKLVKKRIKEAEDSIRKGIQNARNNAQEILLEAKKEAELTKANTDVESEKIIISAKNEAKSIVDSAEKELQQLREQAERERQEKESLEKKLKDEISDFQSKRLKYEEEAQEIYEEKIGLEKELKEVESKLSAVTASHDSKVEALDMELNFLNSEIEKQKYKLKEIQSNQDKEEKTHQKKVEKLELEWTDLSTRIINGKAEANNIHNQKGQLVNEISELKKDIDASINELRDLRSQHESLQKEKEHLSEEIDFIKSRAEGEAKEVISQSKIKAEKIVIEAKTKAEQKTAQAEKLIQESKEIEEDALEKKEAMLKLAGEQSQEILKDAKEKSEELMEQAKCDREDYVKGAKEKFDNAQIEYNHKMNELEKFIKEEKESLSAKLKADRDEQKGHLEKELVDYKVTKIKEIEKEVEDHKKLLFDYKENYANSWSTAISFSVENAVKRLGIELSPVDFEEFRGKVKDSSRAIILEEDNGEEDVKAIMKFNPKHREKVKVFWKRTAMAATLGLAALISFPYLKKGATMGLEKIAEHNNKANEERVTKLKEEAKKSRTFVPEKKDEYLDSYTDRVLYTTNYVENELLKSYREEWFLNLDTFFVEELILSDEAIVTFISKETNLIKELELVRDGINPQFKEEGFKRMREIEGAFVSDVRKIIKSKSKYKRFTAFKKDYYLKNFPFESDRGLANEKE